MGEKVSFFRSAAFESLRSAVFGFCILYFFQDIDSLCDLSWWDCSILIGFVAFLMVKFFWLCGERVCTGRWSAVDRRREGKRKSALVRVLGWCFVISILVAAVVLRLKFCGPREVIDGVTWRYVVKDGKAVIERHKNSHWRPSISVTTSGALEIPSVLGGYPVVGIGRDAFRGCKKLTSVTIPGSVRYLDYNSFKNCRSLQSVIVNGKLNWIYNAFNGCVGLKEFVVPPENEHMQAVDGMLLNKEGTQLLAGLGGNVSVPEGVASIDGYAFAGRVDLESVIIPNGVTNIGSFAFSGCKGLRSVAIPRGVTDIDHCTFQDCEALSSVVIPDGVRSIGAFAFKGCRSLSSVKLPESVTGIWNDAFRDCSILTSIHVPSNVVEIGDRAFSGTPFLDGRPDGLVVFSGIAYRWKGQCPAEVEIPDGVTRIFDKAFYYRGQMKSVTIPKTVKSIGDLAFADCRSLTSVVIPEGVTNLDHGAFHGCDQLTAVSIPRSLTKVSGRPGHPFLGANIRTVYVAKGDVERVKSMAEELCIKVNSEKWNFGSNEAKFVECDEYPNPPGKDL